MLCIQLQLSRPAAPGAALPGAPAGLPAGGGGGAAAFGAPHPAAATLAQAMRLSVAYNNLGGILKMQARPRAAMPQQTGRWPCGCAPGAALVEAAARRSTAQGAAIIPYPSHNPISTPPVQRRARQRAGPHGGGDRVLRAGGPAAPGLRRRARQPGVLVQGRCAPGARVPPAGQGAQDTCEVAWWCPCRSRAHPICQRAPCWWRCAGGTRRKRRAAAHTCSPKKYAFNTCPDLLSTQAQQAQKYP